MNFRKTILVAALLSMFSASAEAQTNTVRPLSLDEAIVLALQHNLDVQISRFNPQIASFDLAGSYSAYDPIFGVRAVRSYVSSPGGFSSVGLDVPGNETERDTIQPFLSGELPTGLRYEINSDLLSRVSGTRSVERSVVVGGVTNIVIQRVDREVEYSPSVGIDLAQPLLKNFWIDAARQQIWVNQKLLKMDELDLRFVIMDVVNRVEQEYYDLIFAIENVRVQEKALELANRLLAENKRRVEVGALAPLDEAQAEAQAALSHADLLTARGALEAQQNTLKDLITDEYREWHGVFIQPVEKLIALPEKIDVMESWQRGMTQRPDLLRTRADLERRDIIVRYQRNQLFPQLDLIGSYGRNGLDRHWGGALSDIRDEANPSYSYGVVFSIPLSNRGPRNRYRAAQSDKEQALLILKQQEQRVLVGIDDAVKATRTSFERVGATRQARLYAEAALDAEEKKLASGKSTSFVVLQLQRDLTRARSDEIRALADYNKALAELAFREGTVFERNRLSLSTR